MNAAPPPEKSAISLHMGACDRGCLLDVLLIGELVIVGAEHLNGAHIAIDTVFFRVSTYRL